MTGADRYGVPYMGSKNGIAERVAGALPPSGVLYDLFAGGCAVTHAAMESGKFGRIVANDLDGTGVELFRRAVAGEYRGERRWISREDFDREKGSDPYVSLCWSFGNNRRSYLYAREREPWCRALHMARIYGDLSPLEEFGISSDGSERDVAAHEEEYRRKYIRWWLSRQEHTAEELDALVAKCRGDVAAHEEELRQYLRKGLSASGLTQAEVGRRLGTNMHRHYFGESQWAFPTEKEYRKMRTFMPGLDKDYNEITGLHRLWQRLQGLQSLQSLQRLQRLQRLQGLQSLQRLQRLQSVEWARKDYRAFAPERGAVVYCDPPYRGTVGYGMEFDHEAFHAWCGRQEALVVISEYGMPRDRFAVIAEWRKASLLCATANKTCTERLWVPRGQAEEYRARMGLLFLPYEFN